jgi:hypothetical protein
LPVRGTVLVGNGFAQNYVAGFPAIPFRELQAKLLVA